MKLRAFIAWVSILALVLAQTAAASTPLPAKTEGSGSQPTAGSAVMPGKLFTARYAVAQLDISFNQIEILLFPKPVACNAVAFAPPPYLEVTLDTHAAPMIIGHPSLANGIAFVQVDFHPAGSSMYYAIQPGVSLVLTRVDPGRTGVWHGTLTVKKQRSDGHEFAFAGSFAAHWCGKD